MAAETSFRLEEGDDSTKLAKEELNLLAKLIGGNPEGVASGKDTFKLNLFDNNHLEGGAGAR